MVLTARKRLLRSVIPEQH